MREALLHSSISKNTKLYINWQHTFVNHVLIIITGKKCLVLSCIMPQALVKTGVVRDWFYTSRPVPAVYVIFWPIDFVECIVDIYVL